MQKTLFRVFALLLLSCSGAGAAQYWVATNGNNSNPGTQSAPWRTIAHAASLAQTNDVVCVTPGNYFEAVIPAHSGSPGTNITYVGVGYPITCSFNMSVLNNWRIIGFHFTMTNASQKADCILLRGSTNGQILDNWFDHVWCAHAPIVAHTSPSPVAGAYSILIRSNFFDHPGLAPWLTNGNWFPENTLMGYGITNLLFEYNKAQTTVNMIYLTGVSNVVRNNYFFDVQQSYFGTNLPHVDTLQSDGDGLGPNAGSVSLTGSAYHILLENNVTLSNVTIGGSKFVIAQEPAANASVQSVSDFIIRNNITLYLGSYIYLFDDAYNTRTYNNTFAYTGMSFTNPGYAIEASTNYEKTGAILPTNIVVINDIFYNVNENNSYGTIFIKIPTISQFSPYNDIFSHNLTYLSGTSIYQSCGGDLIGNDPRFVSIANWDTHPTSASPGIAGSMPETTTTASGSATTVVPVVDAGYFMDGWGIQWVNGDVVDVGTNSSVMISSIDYVGNSLTLASPVTFKNGDGVFLHGTQDLGAYRYDVNGFDYGIKITGLTTNQIRVAVTNPAKVRIVRFYDNGLEIGNAPPASSLTFSAPMNLGDIIQARAYALYAETNLVLTSTGTVRLGLAPPSNLQVLNPH